MDDNLYQNIPQHPNLPANLNIYMRDICMLLPNLVVAMHYCMFMVTAIEVDPRYHWLEKVIFAKKFKSRIS